ncbi:MAG: hypothetical protein LUD29_03685 [Clostridia bacterium]|nr:hypothetical protein [Clostridia bacterium]
MRKKFLVIGAIALSTASLLTFTACSSSAVSASLYSTWFNRIEYTGIQQGIEGQIEELAYDISFTEGSGSNNYSVYVPDEYDGTEGPYQMTTKFYVKTYDWSDPEKAAEDILTDENTSVPEYGLGDIPVLPDDYVVEATSERVYVYTIEYTVPMTYVYTDESLGEITRWNTHYSVCYFRPVRDSLQPVFSYEYVLSSTPVDPNYLYEGSLCTFSYQNTVYYNYDCTECVTTYEEVPVEDELYTKRDDGYDTKTTTTDLTESKNELFDNSSVYTVMRALNYYTASSFTADIFIPLENNFSTYTISGSVSTALSASSDSQKKMLTALANGGYFDDTQAVSSDDEGDDDDDDDDDDDETGVSESDGGNENEPDGEITLPSNIYYSKVSLELSADLSGPSQEVWYAAQNGEESMKRQNYTRSTMLYVSIPFAYSLGSMEFTLSDVLSVFNENEPQNS